ncbi:flavonol 3-O-glucosyltransferase F3GT2 [Eucalyptus grandis]|uniref:flavonol 3-O-glucosyltransferase F3GT2 n=1 Tax=Eucalyptus grandis TaxID=71139 RepID=UPI00192E922B|nr:flavonol 3-O-glucosyltransferase F3GT2 [Eucalyptus grandis]
MALPRAVGEAVRPNLGKDSLTLASPWEKAALPEANEAMVAFAKARVRLGTAGYGPQPLSAFANCNRDLFPHSSRTELLPNVGIYDVEDGLPAVHDGAAKLHWGEQVDMFLRQALESFRAAISAAEREARKKVGCLLGDAFLLFGSEFAKRMRVPWVTFWVDSPCFLSACIHVEVLRKLCHGTSSGGVVHGEADDKALEMVPGLSLFRMSGFPDLILQAQSILIWMVPNLPRQMSRVLP